MEWLRAVNPVELTQVADEIFRRRVLRLLWAPFFNHIDVISHDSVLWDWKPVIDGELLTDYPTNLIRQGLFANVPVIIGYVATDDAVVRP